MWPRSSSTTAVASSMMVLLVSTHLALCSLDCPGAFPQNGEVCTVDAVQRDTLTYRFTKICAQLMLRFFPWWFAWKSGHYFYVPRSWQSLGCCFSLQLRSFSPCVRHRRGGGGVAGSLDSQVTRHQLVAETHCSVVVLCGHTHRSSKPASITTTITITITITIITTTTTTTTTTPTGVYPKRAFSFCLRHLLRHLLRMDLSGQPSTGAAQRRKQRRL